MNLVNRTFLLLYKITYIKRAESPQRRKVGSLSSLRKKLEVLDMINNLVPP